MTTTAHPTITLELNIENDGVLSHPNAISIVFTPEIVATIARALAGLHVMDVGFSEVIIDFNQNCELFQDGEPWIQDEKEAGEGDFDPSSYWLKIQPDTIAIEIWDEHGGSELHGAEQISNIPGLAEALENAKADAYAALRARLI